MDFSKLTNGQKIALGSGVVLIINLFLPWYGVLGFNINAFDAGFLAWGGSLIAVAGAVILALKAMGTQTVTAGTLKTEQIALVLGGLGLVLVVLRFITESSITKFGLYLGILAAAGVTYGAFASMKEQGMEMPGVDDFKSLAPGDDDDSE